MFAYWISTKTNWLELRKSAQINNLEFGGIRYLEDPLVHLLVRRLCCSQWTEPVISSNYPFSRSWLCGYYTKKGLQYSRVHLAPLFFRCYWTRDLKNKQFQIERTLPSQRRCTRCSSPAILSMILLSNCSFTKHLNARRLSIFRISKKSSQKVAWYFDNLISTKLPLRTEYLPSLHNFQMFLAVLGRKLQLATLFRQ